MFAEIIGERDRDKDIGMGISMRPPGKLLGRATCLAVDFVEK
jgi:hypothetical protein